MSEKDSSRIAALRLYFPLSSRAKPTRFWHRLSAPALAQHLITAAKKSGVQQAMLHLIRSGYLPGERISHHHPEVMGMSHPQCLELVDSEVRLRAFLHEHAEELRKVHAVLFLCELPLSLTHASHARIVSEVT